MRIPLSLTVSNRTELVKGVERSRAGRLSFNLDSLLTMRKQGPSVS
jgi:hypothetical protein